MVALAIAAEAAEVVALLLLSLSFLILGFECHFSNAPATHVGPNSHVMKTKYFNMFPTSHN